jgi:hypothetical protein
LAIAKDLVLCPQNYQSQLKSVLARLAADAPFITGAFAILDSIEQALRQ